MKRWCLWGVLMVLSASGCTYDNYAQRGAVLGGLTGTAIGAAIGEANDEPLAGAAIGALAGGLAGTAIGDGVDQDVRNEQARYAAQQQWSAQAVTPDQLVQMSQSGLSDDVIVTHLQTHGVRFAPTANDLVILKSQGVSDRVLIAVQSQAARPTGTVALASPRPVIVEEHYYAPWPRPRYSHFHHHRAPYCPPRGRSTFGFSFSSR